MVCGKCGKVFDESAQATEGRCPFCKTVHTPEGDPIRELKGILSYIAQHFGEKTLLDRRRTDALIADIFPKENAARRLCYVALYDGCAQKLWTVRGKPFEVRSAAAARCVKSLRDEIGLKGRSAASAVEAVAEALGCDIAFRMEAPPSAAETESRKNITDSAEQYSLGRHFDRIKDYSRALYWFVQSAQQDCAEAEYYVGFYLMEGRGGTQDVKTAREWFLRAAENGVPAAQYMTGYFYAEGIACELNEGAAFEWFLRSAKQGYEEAIKVIALSYETGTFVDETRRPPSAGESSCRSSRKPQSRRPTKKKSRRSRSRTTARRTTSPRGAALPKRTTPALRCSTATPRRRVTRRLSAATESACTSEAALKRTFTRRFRGSRRRRLRVWTSRSTISA